jgi:hypothetical protein
MGNGPKPDVEQRGVEPSTVVAPPPGDGPGPAPPPARYCQTFILEDQTPAAAEQIPAVAVRGQAESGRYRIFAGEALLGFAPIDVSKNFDNRGGRDSVLLGSVISRSSNSTVVTLCLGE